MNASYSSIGKGCLHVPELGLLQESVHFTGSMLRRRGMLYIGIIVFTIVAQLTPFQWSLQCMLSSVLMQPVDLAWASSTRGKAHPMLTTGHRNLDKTICMETPLHRKFMNIEPWSLAK